MSRNEERMNAPDLEPAAEPKPSLPQAQPSKVRDLFSFSTAHTEIVDLPSNGKFYPQNHPLHNKDYVEIKYMTAAHEDILTNNSLIKCWFSNEAIIIISPIFSSGNKGCLLCSIAVINVFSGITESSSIFNPVKQKLSTSVKSSSPHKWIPVTPFSDRMHKWSSPFLFNSRKDLRVRWRYERLRRLFSNAPFGVRK